MKKLIVCITTLVMFFLLSSSVSAGTFTFSPPSGNIIKECPDRISIYVDTQGIDSNSADIKINYDVTKILIIDSNPTKAGKQIIPGNAYETFVGNVVNESTGVIRLSGVSFVENLNGSGLFAQIEFESIGATSSATFDIEFTGLGDTLDSNIAEETTSDDILTSVSDATYTFINGVCNPDVTPPNITFTTPQNNQTGVPLTTDLIFTIVDSQSDIDLSTLIIIIGGNTYTIDSPNLSFTGSGQSYTITIVPDPTLPSGVIIASVSVADVWGNVGVGAISFNRPATIPQPTQAPAPSCGQACSDTNPCAGGLSCEDNICKIIACVGRACTCNVTFQACGDACIDDSDCEANLSCSGGLCKIPSCIDVEDCACTPPTLMCEEPPIQTPDFIDNIINNETLKTVLNTITDTYEKYIPEPVKALINELSVPGVATGIISLGLLANILSFLLAVRSPQLLFLWLGLFFGKDKNPWGIVYDATTNKPIPYASIRVFLKGTKTLVEQRITDSDGRYGMVLSAGKYRMEVEHTDYLKEELDINIESDNDVVPNDIELRPMDEEARKNEFRFSIKALFRALNQFLTENIGFMLYFGLATSLLAIFFSRNIFNVVMLVLYAIAALAYYFSKNRGLKKWGEVIDAENNLRIPYAIVKLFDRDTWKMIDTQMTNQNGSFGVFNEPGRYAILVSAKGYEFPSKRQTDLNSVKGKLGVLELDIYQNRELKVKLYVDPLKAGQKQSRVTTGSNYTDKTQSVARPGNLASPFN